MPRSIPPTVSQPRRSVGCADAGRRPAAELRALRDVRTLVACDRGGVYRAWPARITPKKMSPTGSTVGQSIPYRLR